MMRGVGVGIDALQRATPIISGFLLGYVAVLPLIGRVADLVDRQRVLLACLGVFVVGSAVTALATDLPVLVAGRVVQGVGGGGLVPATLAIVAQLWPADRRGVPLGVVGAVQELGSVLGPVLGALVLVVAEWRAIFWLNAVPRRRCSPGPSSSPAGARSRARGRSSSCCRCWPAAAGVARPRRTRRPRHERLARAAVRPLRRRHLAARDAHRRWSPAVFLLAALAVGRPRRLAAAAAGRPARGRAARRGAGLRRAHLRRVRAGDARSWGRSAYALLPVGRRCSRRRMPCTTAAPRSPLVPRGLVRGRLVWALVVSLLVGVALVAVVVDVPLLARIVHTIEPDRGRPGARALPRRRAGRRARRRVGAAPPRQRCRRRGRAGAGRRRAGGDDDVGPGLARPGLVDRGAGPHRPRHRARPGAGQRRRARARRTTTRTARHPRSSSWRGWWAWSWGSRCSRRSGCTSTTARSPTLPDPTDTDALKDAAVLQVAWVVPGAAVAAAPGRAGVARPGAAPPHGVEHATTFGL